MRRRTNAYAFDQDLFGMWCVGGAVWLDDDDGDNDDTNTSTTSADFRNTSATAEVFGNEREGSDSPDNEYNKNKFLSTNDHFRKSPGSQYPVRDDAHASLCLCDPEVAEVQKSIPDKTPAIDENTVQDAPIPLQQITSQLKLRKWWK